MIDLEEVSGLAIKVDDTNHLVLKPGVVQTGLSSTRKFSEMFPVLLDQTAKPSADDIYYMNRGICLESDKELLENERLRYDITVMPHMMLGDEYNKTVGHYHAPIPGSTIAHPEMYEVLNGKALFLLQKMDREMKNLVTVLAMEAVKGDKIIYPPNYGHIIVNIGGETLVVANWVSMDYKALYEPIKEKHGMALYVVPGKQDEPTFVKNDNYKDQPDMRKMNLVDKIRTEFGLDL
jgi:glucose-6-phosphate isomerase